MNGEWQCTPGCEFRALGCPGEVCGSCGIGLSGIGASVGTGDVGGDIGDGGDEPQVKDGGGGSTGTGGVAAHPDHWIESDSSRSGWAYKILSGDTFWGIAVTYLGDGGRLREIRDYQSPAWRSAHPDMSNVPVGTLVEATPDMIASAEEMGILDQARKRDRKKDTLTGSSSWKWVAGAAAVIGVVAIGGAVVMSRRPRRAA